MAREFSGLRLKFTNPQTGPQGSVKPVPKSQEASYLNGSNSFNCYAEKTKVIVDATPLLSGPNGTESLDPGDPENEDVVVDYYEVIYDGVSYRNDDIQKTPITVNNMDANYGLTPRLVFGPDLSGSHTLGFAMSVNGFRDETDDVLSLNG